jgi:predicted nuclease of restriction endonuclease-like RecB superfamily
MTDVTSIKDTFLYNLKDYIISDKHNCVIEDIVFDMYHSIRGELYLWSNGTIKEPENEDQMFKYILAYLELSGETLTSLMYNLYTVECKLDSLMNNLSI